MDHPRAAIAVLIAIGHLAFLLTPCPPSDLAAPVARRLAPAPQRTQIALVAPVDSKHGQHTHAAAKPAAASPHAHDSAADDSHYPHRQAHRQASDAVDDRSRHADHHGEAAVATSVASGPGTFVSMPCPCGCGDRAKTGRAPFKAGDFAPPEVASLAAVDSTPRWRAAVAVAPVGPSYQIFHVPISV
jgi:hypothetical protein